MVVAVPARVRRLARDQGWGKPVARYHTIRPLSGILPMLLIVLAGGLGGVLGAALGGWFVWAAPLTGSTPSTMRSSGWCSVPDRPTSQPTSHLSWPAWLGWSAWSTCGRWRFSLA
jgi:hypothetical protein